MSLPPCMAPDGAAPCLPYQELVEALAASEARERMLRAALNDCHEFFGQMYKNGVTLPHVGEQHLERVAKRVADLVIFLPDAPSPETGDPA